MSTAFQPGDLLANKYRVDDLLGEGGMGTVVAATDTQLDRRVAIKLLSLEHRRNEEAIARFLQEARSAVKLQSEYVVRIFDVGTLEGGTPFIVMEMLRGADLAQVLDSEGPLPTSDTVAFVLQACEAVGEAHVHGIVHRDLKPANLFLSRQLDGSSRIKVLDFGISKLTVPTETPNPSLTRTSLLLGSPMYMSPEQLRNAKDVDGRADIWALGTVLFELLSGRTPFDGVSIPELSAKILVDPVPSPSSMCRSPLPDGLEAVILKALEKDREARFQSVAEFALALAPFAPRRSRAVIERIARIQRTAGLAGALVELPPSEPPQSSPAALTLSQTTASWGTTTSLPAQRSLIRRISLTMGAAMVLGASIGIAVTTQISAPPASAPAPAATNVAPHAPPQKPEPVESQGPQPATAPRTPASERPDAGEPRDTDAGDTGVPQTVATTPPVRPRPSPRKSRKNDVPLRRDFGGRK